MSGEDPTGLACTTTDNSGCSSSGSPPPPAPPAAPPEKITVQGHGGEQGNPGAAITKVYGPSGQAHTSGPLFSAVGRAIQGGSTSSAARSLAERGFVGFEGAASSSGTAGALQAGVEVAVIDIGAAAAGFLAGVLVPSQLSSDDCSPPRCGNQYVVRVGEGKAIDFQRGTAMTQNGYGFSVQTAPGVPIDELARGGYFKNLQISVSATLILRTIPGVSVNAPTPGRGDYHGTVNVPNPPPAGFFNQIQGAFARQPNPYPVP